MYHLKFRNLRKSFLKRNYVQVFFCIISLSKFKEKRGKQTDSIVHIEEILRKHGGDLEKKIQVLELENKEYIDENKSLEQR